MPSLQDATPSHFYSTPFLMGGCIYYAIHAMSLLKMINSDINYMNLRFERVR